MYYMNCHIEILTPIAEVKDSLTTVPPFGSVRLKTAGHIFSTSKFCGIKSCSINLNKVACAVFLT